MADKKKAPEQQTDRYVKQKIATETQNVIQDTLEDKVMSMEDALVEILNKLDTILNGIL